jgi:cytochrome c-type biogenesis protein CcmH/NrfG
LARAIEAEHLQPYAASPWLQEALVEEQAGHITAAIADARRATANELTSSNNWLVLSRLEARAGHASAALADYRRADALNPNSPIFALK